MQCTTVHSAVAALVEKVVSIFSTAAPLENQLCPPARSQTRLRWEGGVVLGMGWCVVVKKFEHFQPVFLIHFHLCNVVGNSNDGKDDDRGDTRGLLGIASPLLLLLLVLCSSLLCAHAGICTSPPSSLTSDDHHEQIDDQWQWWCSIGWGLDLLNPKIFFPPLFLSRPCNIYPPYISSSVFFESSSCPNHCCSLYKPLLLISGHPETLHVECSW